MKRATCSVRLHKPYYRDFNPRPREEGDGKHIDRESIIENISIHALVKRATFIASPIFLGNFISIHALVKRATFQPKRAFVRLM